MKRFLLPHLALLVERSPDGVVSSVRVRYASPVDLARDRMRAVLAAP